MNEIWCSRSQAKMSRWLMFSNCGARCWKPQEDSNSDEWTLTCRSMSSGNSLTQMGPNSRKMCLKMLKKAWFIHDKDVDLIDSICTCKAPPKTGSFGLGEMILMRALHSSAPDRHRHVGHSPVPGVSVWNTGARCTRKRIRVQKGFLLPFADANDGVSSPMIGVWLWACPLKKKTCEKAFSAKIIVMRLVPSHGEKIPQPRKTCIASRRHQRCLFAIADLHPSCSAPLSDGRVVAGLQC